MIFTGAVIADIHFGALPAKELYYELKESFLKFIRDKYLDMIVIAGDYFHSITALNSSTTYNGIRFMAELVDLCKQNGIRYIRIIEGTLSHDNGQIDVFSTYESDPDIDYRVILGSRAEILDNGIKILYIPEEYMKDPIQFYKGVLEKPKKYYDFIFGHGMFKEVAFVKDDGETSISKAPVFDSKLLCSLCKGPIFFGHIHISQSIRSNIYYPGSFSRWSYGEEQDKGFYIFAYDSDTGRYATEFIVNKLAKRYDTLKVYLDKYDKPMESLIVFAKEFKVDNLRIQLIVESGEKDYSYDISFLKEYYTGKKGYKLDILDKREKLRQEQTEQKVQKILTDYNFLFDNDIPVETKIHRFIKRKYSRDVSEEMIRDLLNLNVSKTKG